MRPTSGSVKFLAVVVALYILLAFYDFALFQNVLYKFAELFLKVAPILVLVFVIMSLLNLYLQPGTVKKMLGTSAGPKGWAVAMIGGVLSAGPIYMWYPLLEDLKKKGMKDSLAAAFLCARAIKIPLLPMMIYYFGWTFTATLCISILIFSVIGGVIVEKLVKNE